MKAYQWRTQDFDRGGSFSKGGVNFFTIRGVSFIYITGQDPDKNLTDAYTDKMWTFSMCMGIIGNCCVKNQKWPVGPGKSENIGGVRALDALWCILAILLM